MSRLLRKSVRRSLNYKLLDEDVEKHVRGSRGEALGEEAIRVRQMEWEHSGWLRRKQRHLGKKVHNEQRQEDAE